MQCGYCTPGWLTATAALLNRVTRPDDARIAAELAGNVCRCCTYPRILRAIRRAAELMEEPELLEPVPPGWIRDLARASPPPDCPGAALGPGRQGRGLILRAARRRPGHGRLRRSRRQRGPGQWGGPDESWVHVGADGSVTAFTGKVEAGQGTRTALGLLVAEELAVPPGIGARGHGQHRCLTL